MTVQSAAPRPTSVKITEALEPAIEWLKPLLPSLGKYLWSIICRKRIFFFNRNRISKQISVHLATYASERVHKNFTQQWRQDMGLFYATFAFHQVLEIRQSLVTYDKVNSILSRIEPERAKQLAETAFKAGIDYHCLGNRQKKAEEWKATRTRMVEVSCLIDGNEKNRDNYSLLANHCFKLGRVFTARMVKKEAEGSILGRSTLIVEEREH